MSRVFANGLGDWGSIPGRVIPKTKKMVLDAALLNTQHNKERFVEVAIEKGAFRLPSTTVANITYIWFQVFPSNNNLFIYY